MVSYFGCGWFGLKEMLLKIKYRHLIGLLLISYQLIVDFFKLNILFLYYTIVDPLSGVNLPDTYEGPMIFVGFMILHRAVIQTTIIYCFTGNISFTKLFGILELILFFGLIVLYFIKYLFGTWIFLSFEIFATFLYLLKTPMLLVLFLPTYYIINRQL